MFTGTRWYRGQAGKENIWLKSHIAVGATIFYRVETKREREEIKKTGEVKAKAKKESLFHRREPPSGCPAGPSGSCSLSASSHLSSRLPLATTYW